MLATELNRYFVHARLLGTELNRIFVHVRWPVQSYVLLGFLFGLVVAQIPFGGRVLLAFASWLLLCGGLTVFNSYYDKDEEPVGGMMNPPKVTVSLLYGSIVMQLIALAMAFWVSSIFFYLSIVVAVIYVGYSHKAFRFKSNGFAAVFLNSLLGALTILAATSLSGNLLLPQIILAVFTAALYKASVYMMMQVHQIEEDKVRGDTSVAVMFGRKITLQASIVAMVMTGALAVAALYIMSQGIVLPALAAAYFITVLGLLVLWIRKEADPVQDAVRMKNMIYFTGYVGSAIFVVTYAFLDIQGLI